MKELLAFLGIMVGGMTGGQGKTGGKAPRRFGVPVIASVWALSQRIGWRSLAFLLWIPILSMGYGVDSQLGAILGHCEWLIRVVYAILVSLPFIVFLLWRWVVSAVLLIIAYAVRAGSIGNVPWFGDFLVEDIIRFSTLGGLVLFHGITYKRSYPPAN